MIGWGKSRGSALLVVGVTACVCDVEDTQMYYLVTFTASLLPNQHRNSCAITLREHGYLKVVNHVQYQMGAPTGARRTRNRFQPQSATPARVAAITATSSSCDSFLSLPQPLL